MTLLTRRKRFHLAPAHYGAARGCSARPMGEDAAQEIVVQAVVVGAQQAQVMALRRHAARFTTQMCGCGQQRVQPSHVAGKAMWV